MVISTHTKFVSANMLLSCQSLSITEAAITGGDKSEHTQSTCPQTHTLIVAAMFLHDSHDYMCQ